jgi:hypothetical protein
MKKIDIKSLLVGMILGVCVLLALGAATGKQADIGRYQVACPDSSSACFVIDTTTGQVWQRFGKSNGQNYGSPDLWNKK